MLWVFLRGRYADSRIAAGAMIASSLTLPFVWFVFPMLPLQWTGYTAMAEAFAVVAEAGFYFVFFKALGARDAVAASVLCNWTSFVIGLALI